MVCVRQMRSNQHDMCRDRQKNKTSICCPTRTRFRSCLQLYPSTALPLATAPGPENANKASDLNLDVIDAGLRPYCHRARYPRRVEQLHRLHAAARTPSRPNFRLLKVHQGVSTSFQAEFAIRWHRFCWCGLGWTWSTWMCQTIGATTS